jgi:UPF0755 protein
MGRVFKWIFIVVILFGLISCLALYVIAFKPNVKTDNGQPVMIYIKTGSSYNDVLIQLNSQHILSSVKTFDWLANIKNYPATVKPGCYQIQNQTNNQTLINLLRSGKQSPIKLSINNIRTKQQLADLVSQKLEADSLDLIKAFTDSAALHVLGFNNQTVLAMFIPNTYEFYWNTNASQFMRRMHKEYQTFWNNMRLQQAQAIGLTPVEVVTLASIVQEETQLPDDRPIIAGVYMNRIKKNMPLEADPTLKFALNNFAIKRLLNEDKKVESPYNTYKYSGLPPGPINLPSITYVDAVLNYTRHKYLFFCASDDLSGRSNFAITYAEHLVNARRYQAELNRRNIKR